VKHIELVIGTRPEMVQALPLVRAGMAAAATGKATFSLVTVSQHTDPIMSTEVLPAHLTQNWPTVEVSALPFSLATALSGTQTHFALSRPDAVIVIGDTDTSLAAALAATELRIPVAHVESGLRSHDWAMKEERNRVLIDHLSTVMFPPTTAAAQRLHTEGVHGRIVQSGDVHVDAFRILEEEGLLESGANSETTPEPFLLSTIHRRENILEAGPLRRMVELLTSIEMGVHLALHPHTRMRLEQYGLFEQLTTLGNVTIGNPLAFLDFVRALKQCSGVITDSGGVQKQAWMLKKPCITLRSSTEWVETLEGGWNQLIDPATVTRLDVPTVPEPTADRPTPFGDGFAAERIIAATLEVC
jgi:UDP-N-acetylglucosamine 2-epimerase (non-hydrolysing)